MKALKGRDDDVGLVGLAPELIHKVALSGWLEVGDVAALSETCCMMASILVWDEYGKDLHVALLGVMENVRAGRWRSARYAVGRGWYGEEECGEEGVWKVVVEGVVGRGKIDLTMEEDLKGWEDVLFSALSLPAARVCLEGWTMDALVVVSLLHVAAAVGSLRLAKWVAERGGDLEVKDEYEETPLSVACMAGHVGVAKQLVESGADVTARNDNGESVLHTACGGGGVAVVRYLLGLGVFDVNEEDDAGESPLSCACSGGHVEVVKVLMEEGGESVDVDVEGRNPFGPLFDACYSGKVEIVRMLVDAGAGSAVEKDGGVWERGLVMAAGLGHGDVVRELLGMGVGADGKNSNGSTALGVASRGGHVDVIEALLWEGEGDVNIPDTKGKTPLFLACEWGREDAVSALLEAGADPEIPDENGDTPLGVAQREGWDEIVEMLEESAGREDGLVGLAPELIHKVALEGWLGVEDVRMLGLVCRRMADVLVWDEYGRDLHMALRGVDKNVREKRWRSARYAVSRGWYGEDDGGEESVWRKVAVVGDGRIVLEDEEELAGWESVMLTALALPRARGCLETWDTIGVGDGRLMSLLHVAAFVGSERMVDWVVERGGDLEVRISTGGTPLFVACRAGHEGVARRLVEAGADATVKDLCGQNVLHAACKSGHLGLVQFVLHLGLLDVDELDNGSDTPLIVACNAGHLDVVKLLVEGAGAGAGCALDRNGGAWVRGLVEAATEGHVGVVQELLRMGVAVDGVDGVRNTALCRASWKGYLETVKVLLYQGNADVDKKGFMGRTPLYWACMGGMEDVVKVLLAAGAAVGIANFDGVTPLDIARRKGWDGVVAVLEEWVGGGDVGGVNE